MKPKSIVAFAWTLILALFAGTSLRAQTLREASGKFPGLRVGAAIKASSLTSANYSNTLRYNFNLPSPENDTKWGTLRPTQAQFAWSGADTNAAFARAAGEQMRGHTLLWYKSLPDWLGLGTFSTTQLRDILFDHIDTVGAHYRGDVFAWDVVNEAFLDDGSMRDSIWYNDPGIGYAANGTRYIEESFKRTAAAAADPDALLIYNDYGAETVNAKSDAIYAMAQDFISRGVPIDGIGFQMHISGINYTSLRTNFQRFNDLGLDLHITEMDVRLPVDANGVATQTDLDSQAEIYWNVLGVALGQPRFKVFQTWGLADNDSWIPGFYPGEGAALLFDKTYQRKPAYWAVWNALANQAEKLTVLNSSVGDTTDVFNNQDTLSAGAGRQLDADAAGDFMTLALPVPSAGQWNVKVGYRRSNPSGKFQLATAPEGGGSFTNLGGVVDAYNANVGTGATDLGDFTAPSAGNWQFRFTVTGQNANASDYNLTIDYIRITPVSDGSNTAPTITSISDKTTPKNIPSGPHSFTVGDGQTAASALTVEAVSLNTTLLPTGNIVLGGSGASRTVTLTPAANQSGSAAVLLLVSDGINTTPETFILNVAEVDYNPNWTRTTTGTQSWGTASNWASGAVPTSTHETRLRFMEGITLGTGTVTANNNVAGTFSLGGVTLGGTGGASTASGVTISGNALSLATSPSTGTLPTVNLDANKNTAANSSLLYTVSSAISLAADTTFTGSGTADFVFSGALGSAGSLTKNGNSTLKLTGANTYAGSTTITGGILQIGNNTATGTLGTGAVANNGTLVFNRSDTALVVPNAIGGAGVLRCGAPSGGTATAVITLTGTSDFAGSVTIDSGTLQVGNNTATGTLGTASITNNSTLRFHRSDATLVVSNSIAGPGLLEFGLATGATSTAITELDGPNTFTGGVTVNSGGLRIRSGAALGTGAKLIYLTGINSLKSRLILNGGAGDVTLPASLSFKTSNNDPILSAIINEAGNNTIAGDFTLTSGGGTTAVNVQAGTLTLSGIFKPDSTTRSLDLMGAGNGTFSGALQNHAAFVPALTKSGSGTWAVTGGAHNFSGITTVSGGTLLVQAPGSLPAGSAVTVNNGGTLAGNGTVNGTVSILVGGVLAPGGVDATGTLTLSNNSAAALTLNGISLPFDVTAAASSDQIAVSGNLVLNGTNTVALAFPAGPPLPGTYTLMTYAAKSGTGTLALTGSYPNASLTVGPTSVTLTLFASEVTWTGSVDGTWNTTTLNWSKPEGPATYTSGDKVIFNDTATANLTITGDASPFSVAVAGGANNFTLAGAIGGAETTVSKSGIATLTLSGANTYGGATTLSGGILDVGPLATGSLGGGALLFSGGAVLQGSGTFTRIFSGSATAGNGQITGTSGGFAARGEPLTINFGGLATPAGIALSNGNFSFGTNLVFGSPAANRPVTVVNPVSLGGANRTITVNSGLGGDFARLAGVVSDTWGIIKNGTGMLALAGNNTHTGVTTINTGTLRAEHNNAFGIGGATTSLNGTAAVLELADGVTINRTLTITNTGDNKIVRLAPDAASGGYSGAIQIDETGASNFDLLADAGQALTVSGKISGTAAAGIDKLGSGTVVLSATDNAYTSPTRIKGGVLIVNTLSDATVAAGDISSPSSIGSTADFSTNLVISGGTLRHAAANVTSTNRKFATGLNGATIDSSAVDPAHTISFTSLFAMGFNGELGARTLTLTGTNTGTNRMNLDIENDASGNPTSLVKNGPGTWHLTGTNHYTGDTTVNAGTLHLGENGQLRFHIGDTSGTNSRIAGEGTVVIDGAFLIDTAAPVAAALTTGSWALEEVTTLTTPYGPTFSVIGFSDSGNNRWTKLDGTRTWTFDESTGTLVLSVTPSADPFVTWMDSLAFNNPPLTAGEKLPGADPDSDGTPNFLEFALNGNPTDPADSGLIASLIQDASSPAGNELTLIFAARAGAIFTAGTATVAGLSYTVEGSLDLVFATSAVSGTGPSNTAPLVTGLPDLTGSEWEYHTFKLDASEGLTGKGFLRLKVTQP